MSESATLLHYCKRGRLLSVTWSRDGLWWLCDQPGYRYDTFVSVGTVLDEHGTRLLQAIVWKLRLTATWPSLSAGAVTNRT